MGSQERESPPPAMDLKAVMAELIKGQDSAARLEILLKEEKAALGDGANSTIETLIKEILGAFFRVRTAFDSRAGEKAGATLCSDDQRRDNSGGKRKIQTARKSGYRRRAHPYSCRRAESESLDDGYTWRKYGQKEIFSSNHPRSYFRCTHKHDRECQATRQVQRKEDDPSLYVITYMGEHTCRDASKSYEMLSPSNQRPPYIISFGSSATANNPQGIALSLPLPSLKQECDEEVLSNAPSSSCSDQFPVLPDLPGFEGSIPLYSGAGLDQCDVTSSMHSSNSSLGMEFIADSFEFEDVFSFLSG